MVPPPSAARLHRAKARDEVAVGVRGLPKGRGRPPPPPPPVVPEHDNATSVRTCMATRWVTPPLAVSVLMGRWKREGRGVGVGAAAIRGVGVSQPQAHSESRTPTTNQMCVCADRLSLVKVGA